MKPSDAFGICVRVLGLLAVLGGLAYLIAGLCMALRGQSEYRGFPTWQYLLYGVLDTGTASRTASIFSSAQPPKPDSPPSRTSLSHIWLRLGGDEIETE